MLSPQTRQCKVQGALPAQAYSGPQGLAAKSQALLKRELHPEPSLPAALDVSVQAA